MITMHGALNPKSDNNRIYLSGGRGGRGLITKKFCTSIGASITKIAVLVGVQGKAAGSSEGVHVVRCVTP